MSAMDEQDIFSEIYGEGDGNAAQIPIVPSGRSGKTAGRKRKKKGGGVVSVLLALILVGGLLFLGYRLLLAETCLFGHIWKDATCTTPRLCRSCGQIEGEALGHRAGDPTCTEYTRCLTCGEALTEPMGHIWNAVSRTCLACGKAFPEDLPIPEDALAVDMGNTTYFYKVFAISTNKWAHVHCNENAVLFPQTGKIGWETALEVCASQGGQMAEIRDLMIQEAVFGDLIRDKFSDTTVYFGLTDQEEEGSWKWLSGQEGDFLFWKDGQPDGKDYKNYAGIWSNAADGAWRSGNFAEDIRYFLCQWSLDDLEE